MIDVSKLSDDELDNLTTLIRREKLERSETLDPVEFKKAALIVLDRFKDRHLTLAFLISASFTEMGNKLEFHGHLGVLEKKAKKLLLEDPEFETFVFYGPKREEQ